MASFVGTSYNENDVATQCYYQAYHYNTGKWSDIRLTAADGYYSRDHEDSDWDGNGVPMPDGDVIILVFWSNGTDKSGLKDRMSIHRVVADGSSVYNIDIQMIPKTQPTCNWTLTSSAYLNDNINSSQSSSDVYQWSWNSKTFLHDDNYYGVNIFDSVGSLVHEYDWDDGNGYVSFSNNTYNIIGDYTVTHKTTNQYGLYSECPDTIRIRYNLPYGSFSFDSINYNLNDNAEITFNGFDEDSRITNLDHYFDSSLVDSNNNLNFVYNKDLLENKTFNLYTRVFWNDGFDDLEFNISDSIVLSNVAPTVNLTINNTDNTYNFISDAQDLEDELDYVRFKIYLCSTAIFEETPTECNWSLLSSTDIDVADWNSSATFYKGGKFKVTAQARDLDGAWSNIDELEFDVQISEGGTGECTDQTIFFDWE